MKKIPFGKVLAPLVAISSAFLSQTVAQAQPWKLIAISGQQGEDLRDAQNNFVHPDHSIFDVNLTTGALTKITTMPFVNDSVSVGFNPSNSLLYYTAGSESYSNNPLRNGHDQGGPDIPGVGYQDSQSMSTYDLSTGAMAGIFNANPCPNPDSTLPCFGLPAPRPTWVLPVERRDSTQIGSEFRARGENEYHAARGLAWYAPSNSFYISDENGIFVMSPEGESKFLARPTFPTAGGADKAKGIAFVVSTNLLIGHQDGVANVGYIMKVDLQTGAALSDLALQYPEGGGEPVDGFGGLLGLAQHPVTGVLYGVRKTSDNFARELVTINPASGATKLVGSMGMHIASITFAQPTANGPWKLIAISGQQGEDLRDAQNNFVHPDHTIFEVSLTDGALTKIRTLPFINDSVSVGFNPADRLLYYTAGSDSYSNNPLRNGHDQGGPDIAGVGYQDSQTMIKVDLNTGDMTAVFNAAPCPNPDPTLPCFGLPAPRPSWVLPVEQRNSTQTGSEFRARGENEYHAARGMAWYAPSNSFYLSDEQGVFVMSPAGDSKFLARPVFPTAGGADKAKGIAIVVTTNLWVGHQDGVANTGYVMQVNPETGEALRDVALQFPVGGGEPADGFGGLLGLAQHPETGVLYGIRKTADNFARELVTINLDTGETTLVGSMGMHIAGLTFAKEAGLQLSVASVGPGTIDLTWTGGSGKFLIQRKVDLNSPTWINLLTTTERRATVVKDLANGFYRILDNYTGPDVIPFSAYMTPDGEPGPLNGNPTGYGISSVSLEGPNKLNYIVTYTGLTTNASGIGANNGHVHISFDSTINGPTGGGQFVPIPSGTAGVYTGVNTILVSTNWDNLIAGKGYVNIHTAVNGGGELRGQLLRSKYVATLNGTNQVPAVTTSATGNATVEIYGNELRYNVSWNGLQGGNPSMAHIHGRASTTENAGLLFHFLNIPAVATGSVTGVGIADTATRRAIVDGLSYVNVHTPGLAGGAGEIRGQLTPAP